MIWLLNILYNFHWVAAGTCARSAQPYLGLWRTFLKANGIASIVNLRGVHKDYGWWQQETAACADLGISHFDTSLNSGRLPQRTQLLTIIGFFDTGTAPFLVKCSGGQDRTSFVSALYLLHTQGWQGWDDAMAHFSRFPYLHFPKRHQRWLRAFFDYAREQAAERPIVEWIADEYDPKALALWLGEKGLADSFDRIASVA